MNLRKIVFYFKDSLSGGAVKKLIEISKKHDESNTTNNKQLDYLIKETTCNSSFYTKRDYFQLSDFPIINKKVIIDNYDSFLSKKHKDKKLHTMRTSGSTGIPFTVLQNSQKRAKVVADLVYYNEKYGQILGEPYYFIRTKTQGISRLRQLMNNEISFSPDRLTDENFEKTLNVISKNNVKSILSYASTYEIFVQYLKKVEYNEENSIKTLFTSAAVMSQDLKEDLESILNVRVIDRYSNQENGVIAIAEGSTGNFKINRSSFIVELLNLDNDNHVEKGELGRIVITDLYNEAIPFIRYDTGDLGVSLCEDMSNVEYLVRLEGRKSDIIYDTKGKSISPHTWTALFRNFEGINQWQLIQNQINTYTLNLNLASKFEPNQIVSKVKNTLGKDAKVQVRNLDDIPMLSSGKFKATICNVDHEDYSSIKN